MKEKLILTNGNLMCARAAFASGCRAAGVYPITPSSEISDELALLLPKAGYVFKQKEDEIAAIAFAAGCSMAGFKAMTITSGPGFALMSEFLGYLFMTEVPLVVINVMRGGPGTGLPTRPAQGDVLNARNPTPGDVRAIVLAPGSALQCYSETVRAFDLAERFMQPIIILSDELVGHADCHVSVSDIENIQTNTILRRQNPLDSYQPYGVKKDEPAILNPFFNGQQYHITGLHHDRTGFPTEDHILCQELIDRHFEKVNAHLDEIEHFETYKMDDADYVIVCYGSVALSAINAIDRMREGKRPIKVGMFQPLTLWPSPEKRMFEIARDFPEENILVVEMNKGQYRGEVERAMRNRPQVLLKANGRPITPAEIETKIRSMHHG